MTEQNKDHRLHIIVSGSAIIALLTMAVTFGAARQELVNISRSVDKIEATLNLMVVELNAHRERITRLETRMRIEELNTRKTREDTR